MNKLFIAATMTVLLFTIPTSAFGAGVKKIQTGHIYPTTSSAKTGVYAYMFPPTDWTDNGSPSDWGPTFSRSIKNSAPQADDGSIVVWEITTISPEVRNRSASWLVKNYVREIQIGLSEVTNVSRDRRVMVDGVRGNLVEYDFGDKHHLTITFVKFGKAYIVKAETPKTEWNNHKASIEQSIGSLSIRPLGFKY